MVKIMSKSIDLTEFIPIDLTLLIRGDNYLDVNHLVECCNQHYTPLFCQQNRLCVRTRHCYFEMDTDETEWLIFSDYCQYSQSDEYPLILITNISLTINGRYYDNNYQIWIRPPNCPKILISKDCIFPPDTIVEICFEIIDGLESIKMEDHVVLYYDYMPLTQSTQTNIVTDYYQISDNQLYPLDYLPDDDWIQTQPQRLLIPHKFTFIDFFCQYDIKYSDLNIIALNEHFEPFAQTEIDYYYVESIYSHTNILNSIKTHPKIIIFESVNGDLLIDNYQYCDYVQLSWI